jgi:electron transfer flavoprotein alpha subunit
MTDQLFLFAENASQLPQLVDFAKNAGAKNVDYSILDRTKPVFPEELAEDLAEKGKDGHYGMIVLPGTKLGREIAPRLAVLLHAGYVDGVTGIDNVRTDLSFERLTFGGTCIETIKVKTPTAIVTLAPGKEFVGDQGEIVQKEIQINSNSHPTNLTKEILEERPLQFSENIQSAERIVAIGRGIRKKEDVAMVEDLARVLNASLGVTRPLVEDLKWFPKEKQIGLSGNAVRPNLYLGLGISGQVQHIVGMRDSKVIVAINKDKTAPMLAFADYSIIGDLYLIVPEMTKQLKAAKS